MRPDLAAIIAAAMTTGAGAVKTGAGTVEAGVGVVKTDAGAVTWAEKTKLLSQN